MNEFLPLATYCFVMSSTPGPNNLMLTAAGANFGYRRTLPQILGINTGAFVQAWVTCLGLGAVFNAYPTLQTVLRIAGAITMLILAWQITGAGVGDARTAHPMSFAQAAAFQAVNPKTWLKSVTLASVFMPAGWPPAWGALFVATVGLVIGFPCISVWALFGVAIRRRLARPAWRRAFNVIMGATLAALALLFLL